MIASGNRIDEFLSIMLAKGSVQVATGLDPGRKLGSIAPYPLRHGQTCKMDENCVHIIRQAKVPESLQTEKPSNARQANTRSAKHQCETGVSCGRNVSCAEKAAKIVSKFST